MNDLPLITTFPAGNQAGTARPALNDAAKQLSSGRNTDDFDSSSTHGSISGDNSYTSAESESGYDAEYYLDGERDDAKPTTNKIGSKKVVNHPVYVEKDILQVPPGKAGSPGRDGEDGKVRNEGVFWRENEGGIWR